MSQTHVDKYFGMIGVVHTCCYSSTAAVGRKHEYTYQQYGSMYGIAIWDTRDSSDNKVQTCL